MIVTFLSACLVIANGAPLQEKVGNLFLMFGAGAFPDNSPGEFGEYFEGDMILDSEQKLALSEAMDSRNGLIGLEKRWPNNTIVYHIKEDDFDEEQVMMIQDAMADIANNSCLVFSERKAFEQAVIIQSERSGCFSSVGYGTPNEDGDVRQVLNLGKRCFKHGTIVHEMLHTIGFYHMQSTYDRDDYVEIIWENIKPGREHNFAKYNNDTVTDFGVEYDYGSVMHYPEKAFSKNGNKTIIALKEDDVKIGQRKGMSERDILKLNKMYCEETDTEIRDIQN